MASNLDEGFRKLCAAMPSDKRVIAQRIMKIEELINDEWIVVGIVLFWNNGDEEDVFSPAHKMVRSVRRRRLIHTDDIIVFGKPHTPNDGIDLSDMEETAVRLENQKKNYVI